MNRISILLYKKLTSTLSHDESLELERWMSQSERNRAFASRVTDPARLALWRERRRSIDSSAAAADMRRRIALTDTDTGGRDNRHVAILSAAAAAIVLIALSCMVYLRRPALSSDSHQPAPSLAIEDICSGKTEAVLSASSWGAVSLSDTTLRTSEILFARQSYQGICHDPADMTEQVSLRVPRGGEFKITLEDSTEVWLNADSRLVFPATFDAGERRVRVTGEAYFAVSHDDNRPFYVETGPLSIRVCGTEFNVRNYDDESASYITLSTGSILLGCNGKPSTHLSPGHRTTYDKDTGLMTDAAVDPTVITSWRNGKFVFEEQPLKNIMRDLSRWYDFDYEFADPDISEIVFLGSIPRYADFATAISVIRKCADLQFTTRDGKVYISR